MRALSCAFATSAEARNLDMQIMATVNAILKDKNQLLQHGTVVDAALIAEPSSTKSKEGQRDPEMHQSKKGNQWHFGMKCHIGLAAQSDLVHSVFATAGNVSDISQAHKLLDGKEVHGVADSGYQAVDRRDEGKASKVTWHVAMRKGKRKAIETQTQLDQMMQGYKKMLAQCSGQS